MSVVSKGKVPIFLLGGGETGERIRQFDWTKTELGNPEKWEQSLKTCVRIMLSSSQPIWIGWGKDLIKLYNDPYKSIVGGKHPSALGQPVSEVWKDIWPDIEPMLEKVMIHDEGTYVESQLLIMERNGYPEETYYTFSYTPIPGDNGITAGVFCANTDDTFRVINERALETLRNLGKISYHEKSLTEIYSKTAAILGQNNKDFPFALFYEINENEAKQVAWAGDEEEYTSFPMQFNIKEPTSETRNICNAIQNNELVLSLNKGRRPNAPKGFWDTVPEQILHIPLCISSSNCPNAVLTIGLNPYRKYDRTYQSFVQLLTDQILQEMNNVQAMEIERKRTEALLEIDKAKTLFFNNISHEFRTPLTLMLGPLEELLRKTEDDINPQHLASIETAHRNAIRLLRLVNTLLDFSRIESGRQQAHFLKVDIATFTKDLAANFQSAMKEAGLKFTVIASKISEAVYIDKQMWEKIVFNLLSNAFKYTLKGSISINLFMENKQVVLQVSDTGMGIPEAELPKMFERFHRVKGNSGRSYEGTGIGLSLIKELVNLHQGTIEVSSIAASEKGDAESGSTFTVRVPLGKEHLPAGQYTSVQSDIQDAITNLYSRDAEALIESEIFSVKHNGNTGLTYSEGKGVNNILPKTETILVVDDNADMRIYLKSLLEKKYEVTVAKNGKDALDKLYNHKIHLVLSDIMMPVMDGIELLKEIKKNQQTARIPVILLSARAGEEAKIEGYDIGADDYLVKPFSSKELLARVRAQIQILKLRNELEDNVRNLFLQAPACICLLHGPQHVFQLANDKYFELVGYRDIIGKPVKQALPELEGTGLIEILDEVYHTGKAYSAQELSVNLKRANGTYEDTIFNFVYQPSHNAEGKTDGVMVFAIDVSEQVNNRKKIEENQKHLSSIISQVNAGIAQTDSSGKFVEVNERYCEITGYSKEELLQLTMADITHDDDLESNLKLFRECEAEGKSYFIEKRYIRKDGSIKWVNMSVSLIERPDGRKFITGICIDITQAKEHEQNIKQLLVKEQQARKETEAERKKIEESEKRFRNIVEQAPDPILILKGENMVLETANEPLLKVWNIDKKSFGKPFLEILPELTGQGFLETLQDVYYNNKILKGEETPAVFTGKDGKKRTLYFNYVYQPYREDDGTISGVLVLATDVTKQVVARRKIRESEKKYRELVTDLPVALYTCNAEGDILLYNEAAIQLWGRVPQAGIEKWNGAYRMYTTDGSLLLRENAPMALTLKEGRTNQFEYIIERKDGSRRNIMPFPQILFDNNGKITGAINLLQDITDEKKATANNAMLAAIVQSSDDAIVSKTTKGIVTSWNSSAEKMFGFTAEEMIGQPILKIIPSDRIDEEDYILSELQKGKSIDHFETKRLLKDGNLIDISLTISPIKDPSGKIIGISKIARDITEAKKAEALLKQSEKLFRMLAQSLPQLVWVTDEKGKAEFVSHKWEEYSGMASDMIVEKWKSIVHPDDLKNVVSQWAPHLINGQSYKSEVRLKNKTGEYRWFAATGEPVFDNEHNIIKWVGAFTDIHHLKKEQQRKDAFLSMASHELKTPVTTIKAYGEIAEMMLEQKGDEQILGIQRKMSKQVNKLTTLITDLLDNIRVEKGKLIYTETYYDFNRLVTEIVDDMQKIHPGFQIKLHVDKKIKLFGDVDKIGQVVNNLINNAIKYAPGTNEIIINSSVKDGGVQLSVQDFGIGIPAEDQPHIFEQFYRVNGDSQSTFPGMGIGLYICAEIINRQGGKIWVKSTPGEGSTFYFWLPFDYKVKEHVKEPTIDGQV
ncbi:MAG: PAS domain S-box protein [Ginsengibacter sp.]